MFIIMKLSRLPIAILCLCARYFWMYAPLLSVCCPNQTAFSCALQPEAYQDYLFCAGLTLYMILFLLDVHILKSKTSALVKWLIVLFLMHSIPNTHWIVFVEFIDGFAMIFDANITLHIQKLISQQLIAEEFATKKAVLNKKDEFVGAVSRPEDIQTKLFEILLNKLDDNPRKYSRPRTPIGRYDAKKVYQEEKFFE